MTSERAFWEWVGRYVASGVFSRLPRDDADAILQFATAIVEDRLVLRRAVHLREVGHGSGEWLAASTRLVDARDPFVQVGFNLAGSPEAIIYSWSGDTDYHLIEPRHEELGLC